MAGRTASWWSDFPLSVAVVATLLVLGVVKEAVHLAQPFTSGGDVAFIELQVRQAVRLQTALGPYSRYGWHHPGPAVFYLFAPIYWLTDSSSRSLFLDSWLLNAGSAVMTVVALRRFGGETVARLGAAVIAIYFAAAGFLPLINPWNPSLLSLPILLVMVLTAATFTGSAWALVGAFAAGSIAMQTDIATVPICGACLVVGMAGLAWTWRRHPVRWRRPAGAAALLVLLLWGLPIGQELFGRTGNLSLLWHFYIDPPASAGAPSHSLGGALKAVSDFVTVVPLGNPTDLVGHTPRLVCALLLALVGIGSAIAWRRREVFLAGLGLITPIGLIAAAFATVHIIGRFASYLFFWCQTLALPALISAGAGAVTVARRIWPPAVWLPAAGAVSASAVAALTVVRSDPISYGDSPPARAAAAAIESAVGNRALVFTLNFTAVNFQDGPLLLTLVKDGYRFKVAPEIDLFSGDTSRATTGPVFDVGSATGPGPGAATRLISTGLLSVWEVGPQPG